MSETEKLPCPFVYSNGHRCKGHISNWRVYGLQKGNPLYLAKKIRLWCSDKNDHAGAISSLVGKERMEFYPDRLPKEIYAAIEAAGCE